MPRLPALLIRIACGVSAMFLLSTMPGWAQGPPTLPPGFAESPEFRARLDAAAADSTLEPWQREFMQDLVGSGAATTAGDPALRASGTEDASGGWEQPPWPDVRSLHTAIYDPVRDRMIVFAGSDGSSRNDVWALDLAGTPAWSALRPTGALPPGRSYHTAIYDPVRDRMVIFAGYDGTYRSDIWALDLAGAPAWSELSPTGAAPTARGYHTAFYDPVRDRMVVFGGFDGASRFNDVWALDLAGTPAWSELAPTGTPPSGRGSHTAIHDPVRDRMVVFGGFDGINRLNDVWALDLAGTPAWSALGPTGAPPTARNRHAAIYDPVRDRMVVFAGFDPSYRNDAWALDLAGTPAWSELAPTGTLPNGRFGHTAIYDPARDRMVVFAGFDGSDRLNDVWALGLGGTPAWTDLTPTGALPHTRSYHTAIYDPVRDRMIVFAGYNPSYRNDVWALSLSGTPAWSELGPTGIPPSPRSYHTAIYDPVRDRMVVFAGYDGTFRNDVWELSLAGTPAWSELSPTGTPPSARGSHTAIHDPVGDRMVVFGGYDGSYRNDVWALSLSGTPAWSAISPGGSPPAGRYQHTAIHDPVRERMIVFGGYDGSRRLNDAWALGLAGAPAWSPLDPTGAPPIARFGHTAIYDPVRDRMVLFAGDGGTGRLHDTWALDLAGTPAWSALSPAGALPPERGYHTAILDPVRDRMVVFAGVRGAYRNDTWWLNGSSLVAVDPVGPPVSARFELAPPRPNPARGNVSFDLSIPHAAAVSLVVHDGAGRVVHRIADASLVAGRHVLVWDRRDDAGRAVPSGIYFVRLQAPGVVLTRKAIVLQ